MTFSVIKNKDMRGLMRKSKLFANYKKSERQAFLKAIKGLTEEKQNELCEFFLKLERDQAEKAKKTKQELLGKMDSFIEKLEGMVIDFKKKIAVEREKEDRKKDDIDLDKVLKQINSL